MRYAVLLGTLFSMQALAVDVNKLLAQPTPPPQATSQPLEEADPYPFSNSEGISTKQSFLAYVSSGGIMIPLNQISPDNDVSARDLTFAVMDIFYHDYGLRISQAAFNQDSCLRSLMTNGAIGFELANFTGYRLDSSQSLGLINFQQTQNYIKQQCGSGYGPQFLSALNIFLQDYSDALDVYIARTAQQQAQQKEATKKAEAEANARSAQKADRTKRLVECLASPQYRLYQASISVEHGEEMIASGKRALGHDDAIAKASGTTDIALRHRAGESIVAGQNEVNESFASYRKLGGTISDPIQVRAGSDPCQ